MNIYVENGAYVPERAHKTDAGLDVRSRETRLVKAHRGAFSFGYTVGRQSVWNDMMNIFAGYSKSAGKEKEKDTDKDEFYA